MTTVLTNTPPTTRTDHTRRDPSPRAEALVAVGLASGNLRLEEDFGKAFEQWTRTLPEGLATTFSEALAEILSLSADERTRVLARYTTATKPITDTLGQLLLAEELADSAKRRGAVFTPHWLAMRATRNCLANWRRLHRSGRLPRVVADVSCGVGAFLYSVSSVFGHKQRVLGIDNHSLSLAYAQLLGWALGRRWDLLCEDALLTAPHVQGLFAQPLAGPAGEGIDVLIGNPPYIRSSSLSHEYSQRIRENYKTTAKGNYDLSIAFIEHALDTLAPDGLASYVLTHKFMTSAYGTEICRRLAIDARVLNVEDFQDYQVFPGYTTYTCILTFARKPPAKRFSVTHFPQGVDGRRDPGTGESSTLPITRLQTHPWHFATDLTHTALRLLRDPRHPLLGDVFGEILQGLRTGANSVFVIPSRNEPAIEKELLVPFVGGEHIHRCRVDSDEYRLIFPYRRTEFGETVPLSEQELRERYPNAWAYLLRHRPVLEERSFSGPLCWYNYSRSQNLDLPCLRKLLIREMLPRAEFAADAEGRLAFCSGYGLEAQRMDAETLQLWTAVLCTPTMEFSLRHNGTQLQSGWFRLLKHHLKRVRLPAFDARDLAQARKQAITFSHSPAETEPLKALDNVVSRAFGLDDAHRELITKYLDDCHRRSMKVVAEAAETREPRILDHSPAFEPVRLSEYEHLHRDRADLQQLVTFAPNKVLPVHRWYKYTQGFSGQLVSQLIDELGISPKDVVLDPFGGCGTTSLICRQRRIPSFSIEISPLMVWVAEVKVSPWRANDLHKLLSSVKVPHRGATNQHNGHGVFDDYLTKAFAPGILSQLWAYAKEFERGDYAPRHKELLRLALVGIMEDVSQIRKHGSHYRYMLKSESIGLQKLNIPIIDPETDIAPIFMDRLKAMIEDVAAARIPTPATPYQVQLGDARKTSLPDGSVSAVITSPPYLNRNNYIAQQKAELSILGMVRDSTEYRRLVRSTLRSHVEGDFPRTPQTSFPEVRRILEALSLTHDNNPRIPHMIAAYFEDLAATFDELRRIVRGNGIVAMVLGNARWGGIVVPVDHLVLKISEERGFKPERVLVTRMKGNSPQQMRQYGRIPVRESIVVMRKI